MGIIGDFFEFITSWYVWMPLTGVLLFLTWRNYRKLNQATTVPEFSSVLLMLEIPKTNDKSELAAEQLFASLHGILRDPDSLQANGNVQEHISMEIASSNGQIRFYVWVPKSLQSFVEGQIYSQYPSVQIKAADQDYTQVKNHQVAYTAELDLTDVEYLPIRTFNGFEVDPLAGITGTLAKMEDSNEELWVQILARPIADTWHKDSEAWIKTVKDGPKGWNIDWKWFWMLLEALWKPPEQGETTKVQAEVSERDKVRISEAESKATKLGYKVKIRLAFLGADEASARLQMQALVGTFKQFNSTNLNGFKMTRAAYGADEIRKYQDRVFALGDGYILNIEELASVYHLPHTNVETPNIVWAMNKTAEPPAKLPIIRPGEPVNPNISAFGLTNFRGIRHQFGMLRNDRSRHIYIIGQTGAGKSGTLELMALSDIYHNQGYAIIDPHGDFAVSNMKFIPERRTQDVVYFNPADTAYPLGFNPLEVTHPDQRTNISSEVIGVLKRMFGDSWGPRLEHILRFTILALVERPNSTMLDITRMLTDKEFRKETLYYVNDTMTLQFWKSEFASWNEKYATEAVAPVLNKVGAFTANPIIRNIIGQPKSTFNIREIMDSGKILIVNLSKGLIGEDNAAILGAFLVTKIQLAAMSRSDIPNIHDRRPFYLYVDEFQNFATDSFATILSEARKYGLNLTVANQYISQMEENVRDAVFGNVGTMISFRVSAEDAPILSKHFEPQFEASDLLGMHNRSFIISMIVNGEKQSAFSATTLTLPKTTYDYSTKIIENSRRRYSRPRAEIEAEIKDIIKIPEQFDTPARQRFNDERQSGQPRRSSQDRNLPFNPTKVSPSQAERSGDLRKVDPRPPRANNSQPPRREQRDTAPIASAPELNKNTLKDIKNLFEETKRQEPAPPANQPVKPAQKPADRSQTGEYNTLIINPRVKNKSVVQSAGEQTIITNKPKRRSRSRSKRSRK